MANEEDLATLRQDETPPPDGVFILRIEQESGWQRCRIFIEYCDTQPTDASMNKDGFLVLYQYNTWSNAKILEAASNLTQEQFVAPVPFPHGSLRGTLVHAAFAEWVWHKRWEGSPINPSWKVEEFPTFESLQAPWANEETRLMDFVATISDEKLYSIINYVSTEGHLHERLLWECMAHLVNHGTQHKTEAAAILTGFGHSPGDIDLIVYLNETK